MTSAAVCAARVGPTVAALTAAATVCRMLATYRVEVLGVVVDSDVQAWAVDPRDGREGVAVQVRVHPEAVDSACAALARAVPVAQLGMTALGAPVERYRLHVCGVLVDLWCDGCEL